MATEDRTTAIAKIFPNPVQSELTLDLSYEEGWLGKKLILTNITGQAVLQHIVTSNTDRLDVSRLQAGVYFIQGNRNGEKLLLKFMKL